LNSSIYTGADQKTLRPVVNLSKTRLTKSLKVTYLQSDIKSVRKENTSLESHKKWTPFSESHREPWP